MSYVDINRPYQKTLAVGNMTCTSHSTAILYEPDHKDRQLKLTSYCGPQKWVFRPGSHFSPSPPTPAIPPKDLIGGTGPSLGFFWVEHWATIDGELSLQASLKTYLILAFREISQSFNDQLTDQEAAQGFEMQNMRCKTSVDQIGRFFL